MTDLLDVRWMRSLAVYGKEKRRHRTKWMTGACLIVLGCFGDGCAEHYYAEGNIRPVSSIDLRPPATPRPLNLEVSCSHRLKGAAELHFCAEVNAAATDTLLKSRLYSEIIPAENVDRLDIKISGSPGTGSLWDLTSVLCFPLWMASVGVIGCVTPEDEVVLEATYTPLEGSAVHRQYRESLLRVIGLVPVARLPQASRRLDDRAPFEGFLRDLFLNLVRDLQRGGEV